MSVPSMAAELREAAVVEAVRARELRDVLGGLAAAGVHPVLLKGAALAYTHYPQPELRPRSDTDFMIPASARAETARVLGVLGYERPLEIEGDVAIGQFHCAKTDNYGLVHALDVHWRVSNVRAFAGVLSYEELARDAVAVQALGSHAFGASAVHALLVACIHRVAHHGDAPNLLWLYDVVLDCPSDDAGGPGGVRCPRLRTASPGGLHAHAHARARRLWRHRCRLAAINESGRLPPRTDRGVRRWTTPSDRHPQIRFRRDSLAIADPAPARASLPAPVLHATTLSAVARDAIAGRVQVCRVVGGAPRWLRR